MSVFEGPLNGFGDEPVFAGIYMDEVEAVVGGGEDGFGEKHRTGDGSASLKEFSAIGHGCFLGNGPFGRRSWGWRGSTNFSPEFAGRLIGKYNDLW
jgi:hypothetical protein